MSAARLLEDLGAMSERSLTREELAAWENAPVSDDERRQTLELVDWFLRRYPHPLDRLRASRRAFEAAARRRGAALRARPAPGSDIP